MIYLEALRMHKGPRVEEDGFPFNVPVIQHLDGLSFRSPVTFFVGENGTGKSTLLEAIAAAALSITVGGDDIRSDSTMADARRLAAHLILTWHRKTHRGFFMRAEDFLNYGRRMAQLVKDLDALAADYQQTLTGYGLALAQGSVRAQRDALLRKYGGDLNARSHGESFLQLFQERFVPGGLYLLDEPDTALSPQRQLALLAMLKQMVEQDGQFIIATHSPILIAYPNASIMVFNSYPIQEVAYDQVENVTLTRSFLNSPRVFLRHL